MMRGDTRSVLLTAHAKNLFPSHMPSPPRGWRNVCRASWRHEFTGIRASISLKEGGPSLKQLA